MQRVALTDIQPIPAVPSVEFEHVIQKVGNQRRIGNPRTDDRVAIITQRNEGVIAFASASPLNSHRGLEERVHNFGQQHALGDDDLAAGNLEACVGISP